MTLTQNRNSDFSVALLIFGRLGKSAELSLKSIANLGAKKICILADKSGEIWIREFIKKHNILL